MLFPSLSSLSGLALISCSIVSAAPSASSLAPRASWPDLPFTTSGRDILGASGQKIKYAGVNWPGAAETMLPEGLQYRSVADIVGMVKSLGMNVIRLTYSIEMIDDNLGNSPNQGLKNTLINALGQTDGQKILQQVLNKNPSFKETTTRLEVFDAIATECAKQQIWVHLDNHVSKAKWCCSETDGNAWFGDLYFNSANWQRGLAFMAKRAKSWPALASMSLRNELRSPKSSGNSAAPYDWVNWYNNMKPAADGIYAANNVPLIFLSGLGYDTDDTAITNGQHLGNNIYFRPSTFTWAKKLVFELHNYQNSAGSCNDIKSNLYKNGYGAMNLSDAYYQTHGPVVLTEFGFEQTDSEVSKAYAQCFKSWLPTISGGPGGWMQWALGGSYYIREGTKDYEETWGLLNHDWSNWRNQNIINNYLKPFVKATTG